MDGGGGGEGGCGGGEGGDGGNGGGDGDMICPPPHTQHAFAAEVRMLLSPSSVFEYAPSALLLTDPHPFISKNAHVSPLVGLQPSIEFKSPCVKMCTSLCQQTLQLYRGEHGREGGWGGMSGGKRGRGERGGG